MTKERYVEVYSDGSQEHANWENSEGQMLRESYRKLICPVM